MYITFFLSWWCLGIIENHIVRIIPFPRFQARNQTGYEIQGSILRLGVTVNLVSPRQLSSRAYANVTFLPSSWHPLKSRVYEGACLCRGANSPPTKCLFGMWIISSKLKTIKASKTHEEPWPSVYLPKDCRQRQFQEGRSTVGNYSMT